MIAPTIESEVRSYCRNWPVVFDQGRGSRMYDRDGRVYLDFFAGASALNYGHNHPVLKRALLDYLEQDGVTHSLDMLTAAKENFLTEFAARVLGPRQLDYRVQFPGPTGTNSVEAALKLARKVTGRQTIVAFTGAFHGMSLGSLAATGNAAKRAGAGVPLGHTVRIPYDGFSGGQVSGLTLLDSMLADSSSGLDLPAAVIVETVQGEGGVNPAGLTWLADLAELCSRRDILLIIDDIQMGCGRTGPFFSFEAAGITPDIVCLSKSLSGYGLPMSLTLFRTELDVWQPGEHNGTFRGNNPAFVTAAAALREFWADSTLEKRTQERGLLFEERLAELADRHAAHVADSRGRGLVWGLAFREPSMARQVADAAFARGLLVETAGSYDEVVKLMPALTSTDEELDEGFGILRDSVTSAVGG
ncbi:MULTISPECIES: diaminobutyrate--2-oxoglutarate transaminase [unclassified Streptomyces]|uniref:diaminobutyrate--2-oxoglutarate transaminase n=1 Tax=unclassified Streptomyces TaxID=2593676 RepID=UPI00236581FA|nr:MULTISPECIES: diaminobutyrate--2-oxoglutarate transaminase [unclassified Streptomyces]MDF3140106.1 diaminobutyrate--2-oxoglutarate transaminase [Streptomyces sp. T21Q-yed]WDF40130.1 diaminobutyrate--2-oxoglutarate transaminase [Streptomyces sp. T12]